MGEKKENAIYFQSRGAEEFRFMSNFHIAPFKIGDISSQSVEHYYQSMKACDATDQAWINSSPTPAVAMKRGRSITPVAGWDDKKIDVMTEAVTAKFEQNSDLMTALLATEGFELIEFAPWGDTFWGVDKNYDGRNELGEILMQIRERNK